MKNLSSRTLYNDTTEVDLKPIVLLCTLRVLQINLKWHQNVYNEVSGPPLLYPPRLVFVLSVSRHVVQILVKKILNAGAFQFDVFI